MAIYNANYYPFSQSWRIEADDNEGRHQFARSDHYLVGKCKLSRVRLVSYDYDQLGRYWGMHSPGSILYQATDSDGRVGYVRARDRQHAKDLVVENFSAPTPYAPPRFYR